MDKCPFCSCLWIDVGALGLRAASVGVMGIEDRVRGLWVPTAAEVAAVVAGENSGRGLRVDMSWRPDVPPDHGEAQVG
ncbi:hypothetical protein GORHZ_049_00100 [Gordonia rhizosphera NBRC 16068]|uniref:Uncharacterized protein n=2 Tax=Gordonia rhizosphera TaxID=83341 RepID=K6WA41_9ACTN|nr:hypothetical protein GORHZ_049_00100 [Gordonia rhizosphera NBRC 16068]